MERLRLLPWLAMRVVMSPNYHDSNKGKSAKTCALKHQDDHHNDVSDWKIPRYTFSKMEFLILQASSLLFAVTVGASLRPDFGVLQLLGIACIEFIFIGFSLRTIKNMNRRTDPKLAVEKIESNLNSRPRDLLFTVVKAAPLGIYSTIIVNDVHPIIAQLGALYIGIIGVGDMVLLWKIYAKKLPFQKQT